MTEAMALVTIDFKQLFISIFIILVILKSLGTILEWLISKLGLETKFSRSNKEMIDKVSYHNTSIEELKKAYKEKDADTYSKIACKEWIDVRSFGQLFAFKKDEKQASGVSIGVRGPVSIQIARSTDPIFINEMQIIKSVNSTTSDKKTSDTMGMKYSIDFAVYKFSGSINVQLAEKTGFSEEDAEAIHKALETLFVNDESSARPAGSMEVLRVYWWKHNSKLGQHSPAEMNRAVEIKNNNEPNAPRSLDDIEFIDKTPEDMKENEQIYEG